MKYRIVITALEPNPNYEAQMKQYSEDQENRLRWGGTPQYLVPEPEREVKKLETVLTESEWIVARNAILGVTPEAKPQCE